MHAGAVAEVTGEHVQFRRPGPGHPRRPRVLVQDGTVHQFRRGQAHKTELQPDTPYQLSDMASPGSDRALAISGCRWRFGAVLIARGVQVKTHRLPVNVDPDRADPLFEHKLLVVAQAGQDGGGANGGMTGERQFLARGEDPDPAGAGRIARRQYERGLREVEFRASCCMVASAVPVAWGNTASRFPPNGRSVNTSTREKSNPLAQPATTSISTAAPSGRAATPIAVRAG
jgi:hypothetical protein